jgi:hypothetical protein
VGLFGPIEIIIVAVILGLLVWGLSRAFRKKDPRLARRFADVERQADILRRQITSGRMTESEGKARMRELMIAGPDGRWWMVGYRSGAWYRHDGSDWAQAEPPWLAGDKDKR